VKRGPTLFALRQFEPTTAARFSAALCALILLTLLGASGAPAAPATADETVAWPKGAAVVGFRDDQSLRAALEQFPGRIVRRLPALRAAEIRPRGSAAEFAEEVANLPGIAYVEPLEERAATVEPALLPSPFRFGAYEWQYAATRSNAVPPLALRAAATVTVAVIDTGADLSAPDLAAKSPSAFDVSTGSTDVADANGHGTFVASLAAGSVTNGEGIAGFGGDARLLVVKVASAEGFISDVDGAAGIVYAVDQGARIINLSFGGDSTSETEQRAIDYAVSRGALLVAAAGNEFEAGNPVIYPAALLQPPGSYGRGGRGLVVAATGTRGKRAWFSSTGSYVSIAAPGENVFAALSSLSPVSAYPRVALPRSLGGLYGFGSGTSFAAPQVAGAAALVWGVNPSLTAAEVAGILKDTAQGRGRWSAELGYGVIDVAKAVSKVSGPLPRRAAKR
jgi:subtilisin family serine protease